MAKLNVVPIYPYESERDDWIQSMIMSGFGCTTIPEFAITVPGLPSRPLVEPEVYRTVNLVTVRGRPHGPAVGALVHIVKKHIWQQSRMLEGQSAGG
jgi:LysR family transcriptional regulator, hydrogen peroxide-inducible genes activator